MHSTSTTVRDQRIEEVQGAGAVQRRGRQPGLSIIRRLWERNIASRALYAAAAAATTTMQVPGF